MSSEFCLIAPGCLLDAGIVVIFFLAKLLKHTCGPGGPHGTGFGILFHLVSLLFIASEPLLILCILNHE